MKTNKLFATLFLMLVFTIKITAQVPPYVPTNGLVGWWPYNGNANDASLNLNNGVVNGAVLTTDRNLAPNAAYNFNNSTILHSTQLIPSNSSFAISFWVKPTLGGVQEFMSQNFWPSAFYIGVNGTNMRCGDSWQTTGVIVANNVWAHYVIVRAFGVNVRIYRNAILVATSPSDITLGGSLTDPLVIGKQYGSNAEYYAGVFDDLGIWNRTLSQAEVTALYNAVSCVAPIASITTQGNSTFCAGGSCTLNANAGNSYTYQWYNNGTLINGATAITFTASQAGNYTVKVTDGLTSCFTTSQPQSVIVNPQPNVSFGLPISSCWVPGCVIYRQINASTIPLNGTPNGGTYQGPGISGSAFSPTVAGLGNKNLKYTYTDNNGCSNFANQSVIIYDTIICPTVSGIIKNSEDLLNEESVKIYPNPNQGFFNLELTECKNSIIKITDVLGKTILNQKAELFNEIDLKNQSSGVYTINIITDKKIKYTTKVIKE